MLLNILLLQHTAENCTGCFFCWAIWMLLPLILGILMGKWIWGKYQGIAKEQAQELKNLRSKLEESEKAYIQVKYQFEESEKDNHGLKAALTDIEGDKIALTRQLNRKIINENKVKPEEEVKTIATSSNEDTSKVVDKMEHTPKDLNTSSVSEKAENLSASSITPVDSNSELEKSILSDSTQPAQQGLSNYFTPKDLQIIEGVGPKIEGILQKAGFVNWRKIADASLTELKDVLHDAGPRYRIHNPKTWSQQATLALEEKWEELIEFQQFLHARKEEEEGMNIPSKVEKLLTKKLGFSVVNQEDLKIIEGIGPQIENLLKSFDINNWEDLSTYPVSRLKQILIEAGERYQLANPSSWPKQAGMAHRKEWVKLKNFQDKL